MEWNNKQVLYVVYLVLIVFIIISLINWVNTKSKNLDYSQEYYARDLALLIDSSYSSVGDLEIKYKMNDDFNLNFENNKVSIKKLEGLNEGNSFYFTKNEIQANSIPERLDQINQIVIRNKEDGLVISDE